MASFTVTGTLAEIFDTQQVSEKFSKREFVLSIPDGQYPQEVKFQLSQDKTGLIDSYGVGQELSLQVNLRGRRYNKNGADMFFNTLEVWKIESASSAAPVEAATSTSRAGARQNSNPALRAQPAPVAADDNDLPF